MATPTQEAVQPAEAGFSTNLFLTSEASGRVQFTFHGARSSDWQEVMTTVHSFLGYMHEKGWMMDGEWQKAENEKMVARVAKMEAEHPGWKDAGSKEPVREAVGEDGKPLPEIHTSVVEELKIGTYDDKLSVHVICKPWTRFGVPMYKEVWEAVGLDIALGKEKPNITGWKVEFICKPETGKPFKVTRLLRPN